MDNGETFECHWEDCFFSDSTKESIEEYVNDTSSILYGSSINIRELTDEEIKKFPELLKYCR